MKINVKTLETCEENPLLFPNRLFRWPGSGNTQRTTILIHRSSFLVFNKPAKPQKRKTTRGENWNTRVERSRPFHRRVAEERGCGETVARAKLTRWRRRRRIHDAVGEYRRTVSRVRCIGQQVTLKVKQCEGTGETTARTAAETGSE